jgi:predicted amino acid racemase
VIGDNLQFLRQLAEGNSTCIEPIHMLHSTTIFAMSQVLKKNGYIVIVSDNRSYIRLVAATCTKIMGENNNILISTKYNDVMNGIIHGFDESILATIRQFESFQSMVNIYSYTTSCNTNSTAYVADGTSYFDRLWRTGAGSHSETCTRFVIVMQRC